MRRSLLLFALCATTFALTRTAAAQGFQVNEHGSCVMGRGGAGVAKGCADGSDIFYNPAGIVGPRGWIISAGVTVIDANGAAISHYLAPKAAAQPLYLNREVTSPNGPAKLSMTADLAPVVGRKVSSLAWQLAIAAVLIILSAKKPDWDRPGNMIRMCGPAGLRRPPNASPTCRVAA